MSERAAKYRTSSLGVMNTQTFLKRTALTCLSALCIAPGARANEAHVDFIPVPDARTSDDGTGPFAHQVLGLRLDRFELPAGYDTVHVVADQFGSQVSHIRFTLDPRDPWVGQYMMRVRPNEGRIATISVNKREHDSMTFSPVITVSHSQYYSPDDVQASYDPEEPTLFLWIYARAGEAFLPPIEVACSPRLCWEVRDNEMGVQIKLTGPHN